MKAHRQATDALIYLDLITSIKTTREAAEFLSEIETLQLAFFKSEKVTIEKALDSISEDFTQKIMQIFSKNKIDTNDKDAVTGFFETLKKMIGKFKVIKLILAFSPTNKTIGNIHDFIKETVGVGYILDIEVSEDVLAGAVVMFDGKYCDFSLKKSIEDAFANRNTEIMKFID